MNRSSAGVLRFTLQSRSDERSEPDSGRKRVCILLVEDNPADAGLVREALEENGVLGELVVANDGERAILLIDDISAELTPCPHLVILDLSLPKRSGREVLEHIRSNPKCGGVPLVVLSSSDSRIDREDAARLGATRYIRKPSRLEEFLSLGSIFRKMLSDSPEIQ